MHFKIHVPGTPSRTSEVFIGAGLLEGVSRSLESHADRRAFFWIWDERVWKLWKDRLEGVKVPGEESGRLLLFPASESNKRLAAVEDLARQLVRAGADRGSALVAVGGGVTGDVVGFLASLYMRGIPHFQVPTTLLAQVDSSIGGKTGVDLPEGKNLLGTFHQPRAVWMDSRFFDTLPALEFRQGMAEVIKTAMIGDPALWGYLEDNGEALRRREGEALERVISACCRLKSSVVELDEQEAGHRRILNLGHTVGHALEQLSDYHMRHGDAVAIGMVVAAGLSCRLGMFSAEDLDRLKRLCSAWDLPITIPRRFTPEAILPALQTDKKRIGDTLHFILPLQIGEVVSRDDLALDKLEQVLHTLREE